MVRFFSDYDYEHGSNVAVLGSTVASTLYGSSDPLGQDFEDGIDYCTCYRRIAAKGICEQLSGQHGYDPADDDAADNITAVYLPRRAGHIINITESCLTEVMFRLVKQGNI